MEKESKNIFGVYCPMSSTTNIQTQRKTGGEDGVGELNGRIIYSVGHSNHEADKFVTILQGFSIDVVVDVRSAPYSKYCPQFNKETIEQVLKSSGIKYLFLGKELGARPTDQSCYVDDMVSFEELKLSECFQQGISMLLDGIEKHNIAIMCSEKEAINCHRAILISRVLTEKGITVKHILSETESLDQKDLEAMLLKKFDLEKTLFDKASSRQSDIDEAYKKQENLICYKETVQDSAV